MDTFYWDLSFSIPFVDTVMILLFHTLGDFILQTRWMAKNKSSSQKALLTHIALYAVALSFMGWLYALVNAVLHYFTDWATSRATKYCYMMKEKHSPNEDDMWMYFFFLFIGLDQLIHMICLFGTYQLMR